MRIARVDKNQGEIVNAFRTLGYSVHFTHALGRGFPDIVVGKNNKTALIEIKTAKGKLTEQEKQFFDTFKGKATVIRSIEDVVQFDKDF